MHPKALIQDAAKECGWSEATQIDVLCDFISQAKSVEPDFANYINQRIDSDYENSSFDDDFDFE